MKELTKKLYTTLGLVVMLVICATGIASAQSEAANLYVKNVKNQALDQHKKSMMVPLSKVLEKVGHARHLTFVYESDLIEGKTVSKTVLTSANLAYKLGKLLVQNGLTYEKQAKGIYVIKRLAPFHEAERPAAASQVTGTVTDGSTGETLPGVNIAVKGTTTGTATDAQGQYELTVESLEDTLVFSFVGYQTLREPINGRTTIDVAMQAKVLQGKQLIVTGYGTIRKQDLTGSVSSISTEDISQQPVSSIDQALQGKAAGVHVTTTSNKPGGGTSIRIRGTNSINSGSEPLYIIDGVPVSNNLSEYSSGAARGPSLNPLASLNPSDIESMSPL